MDQPPELPPTGAWIAFWLAAWVCFSAWLIFFSRLCRGQPAIAFQRRRQAPWGGLDLLGVFAFFLLSSAAMFVTLGFLLGPEAGKPLAGADAETSHEIVQLFRRGGVWTLLLCVVSAVLVAPIVEEFLFRVVLQGYLEKIDRQLGIEMPVVRRFLPWGAIPIFFTSLLFALVHFRVARQPIPSDYLLCLLIGNSLVNMATASFALLFFRFKCGATAADLGFVAQKVPYDAGLGLAAAAAVVLPIFMLQEVLSRVLPSWLAADPVPLFCFAVVLGTLYCRTHRAVAGIVLHMSLNAVSLAALWFIVLK